ncbi:hypothetical protein BT63DRAFT_416123 [Microthyrium microscopicum]|uniref:F-box domain-containing protein n=1 Tax=Microthyrium microscopicum TaxID=703497 RepID=A0A6A6U4I4_9PEZI|nr:hypothetical protein BT63DRAFT_416123 [Microthyrium microscopicum]
MDNASFSSLPSELIVRILSFLQVSKDVLNASLTAREIYSCAQENEVWKNVIERWAYSKPLTSAVKNWKAYYISRHRLDLHIDDTVNKLIYRPEPPNNARIPRFREIPEWDLDCKDRLLQHINSPKEGEDFLARKFWAGTLLKTLHHRLALQQWQKLIAGEDTSLERALAAFDVFIEEGDGVDFDYVSNKLDQMALVFKRDWSDYDSLSTRGKALLLAHYMLQYQGFSETTSGSSQSYYNIRNNFIGKCLKSPTKAGMPLIYVAIYCALAQRLGLDARPINFPGHVYIVIYPPEGVDLDDISRAPNQPADCMYLNVHSIETLEVKETTLRQTLAANDPPILGREQERFLQPADTLTMISRTRRNIMTCLHRLARHPTELGFHQTQGEELVYQFLWINMIFDNDDINVWERRHTHVGYLRERVENMHIGDWYLFQDIVLPVFRDQPEHDALQSSIHNARLREADVGAPKFRTPTLRKRVKYDIGNVFHHKKYHYTGMIIGWDPSCKAPSEWQTQHRIEDLSGGGDQCFYNIVSDDGIERYVAQENMRMFHGTESPGEALMRLAGRYFLRWDEENRAFVSNLKEEYPDD